MKILPCLFAGFLAILPTSTVAQVLDISSDTSSKNIAIYHNSAAWVNYSDGDNEIYYWDGETTQKITNNSADDDHPSLYNGTIAWVSDQDGNKEIYYWDGQQTRRISNNSSIDESPSLYNGTIAWAGDSDGDMEIYYWDGSETHQISSNTTDDGHAQLYEGTIAWAGEGPEIFYWDGTSIEHTSAGGDYMGEGLSLHDGLIAWNALVVPEGEAPQMNHFEIFTWTGAGEAQRLTSNGYYEDTPQVYNGHIAWPHYLAGSVEMVSIWDGQQVHQGPILPPYEGLASGHLSSYSFHGGYYGYSATESGPYPAGTEPARKVYLRTLSQANLDIVQRGSVCDATTELSGQSSLTFAGLQVTAWEWQLTHRENPAYNKSASGEVVQVADLAPGTYDVTLSLVDEFGTSSQDTMILEIDDFHPWDVDNDCKQGLAEVIHTLQVLSGQ